MQCLCPLPAYRGDKGRMDVKRRIVLNRNDPDQFQLPCGQCLSCRINQTAEKALRISLDLPYYERSSFITLTYNDDYMNINNNLEQEEVSKFMKRLRRKITTLKFIRKYPGYTRDISTLYCGEYGDQNQRPHYHICCMGFDFPDKQQYTTSAKGFPLYQSEILDELWPMGYANLGELTEQTAAYTASYTIKKVKGAQKELLYDHVNDLTGELYDIVPEFGQSSSLYALGKKWFFDNYKELRHGYILHNDIKHPIPRYYMKLLEKKDPDLFNYVKSKKAYNAESFKYDPTQELAKVTKVLSAAKENVSSLGHSAQHRNKDFDLLTRKNLIQKLDTQQNIKKRKAMSLSKLQKALL